MFQPSVLWFQIVTFGLIIQSISITGAQDIDKLIKIRSDNGPSYHQQMLTSLGQRQVAFSAYPQFAQTGLSSVYSNVGLIRPANNQNEANNFHSLSHSSKYPLTRRNDAKSNIEDSKVLQKQTEDADINSRTLKRPESSKKPESGHLVQMRDSVNREMKNLVHGNIELALRQTSTDENVFQPSPAVSMPDSRDLEPWSLHSSSVRLPLTSVQGEALSVASISDQKQQQDSHSTDESTTEQSNVIVAATSDILLDSSSASSRPVDYQPAELTSASSRPIDYQPAELTIPSGQYQNEYQSSIGNGSPSAAVTSPEIGQRQQNFTAELHNHVVYEGPATSPTVSDYYFSSSERFPSVGKASNVWWSLGIGHEFEKASNLTRDDYLDYCSNSDLLISNKQRSLCRTHPRIIPIVARGLKMAIDECQLRFTSNRWNCSLVLQETLEANLTYQRNYSVPGSKSAQPFGEVMKHPNRERSFLNAIVAAGLAHAMTKACSNGELPEECSCDKKIKSKNNRGKIEWVACSDDIDFGARFSRDFIDNTDDDSDTTSMINTHNYEVGRRIFKSATDITCTCQNSENGLCQTKRCWKHLGPFSDIGDELMRRYESATHVQLSSKDPHKLRPVRRGVRRPKRKDLVYIDESPDYCAPNKRLGVLGTQNRRCNSTSIGPDSCSLLCCGRGYQMVVEELEEDCNCKFVWCCQVKCDKCRRQLTNDICN